MSGRPTKLPPDKTEILLGKLRERSQLRTRLREMTLKKLGDECGVSLHVIHRAHRKFCV